MSQKKDVSVYYCGFCEMTHTILKKGATCPTCGRRYCVESIETSKEVGSTKCPFCQTEFIEFFKLKTEISSKESVFSSAEESARKYHQLGCDLNESGKYEEAIAVFNKAIEIEPDYALAWNDKGIALEYLGWYNEAIIAYEKAIKLKPEYKEAHFNREAFLRKGLLYGKSQSRCFIATAAYGTPLHPELDVLRSFRDNWLIHRPWGKKLVRTYYITSPQVAWRVRRHIYLKKLIRFGISLTVRILRRIVPSFLQG